MRNLGEARCVRAVADERAGRVKPMDELLAETKVSRETATPSHTAESSQKSQETNTGKNARVTRHN